MWEEVRLLKPFALLMEIIIIEGIIEPGFFSSNIMILSLKGSKLQH